MTFDDAYRNVEEGLAVLERLRIPATVFACSGYAENGRPLDVPELAEEALAHPQEMATMNWEELHGLADRGVEIGSHTITHPHLTRLSDAELSRELQDSRSRLEDELGERASCSPTPTVRTTRACGRRLAKPATPLPSPCARPSLRQTLLRCRASTSTGRTRRYARGSRLRCCPESHLGRRSS